MTNVDPPGADDPALEPPPANEDEENERRERIKLPELVAWYREHRIPLNVHLEDWRPGVEGAVRDG